MITQLVNQLSNDEIKVSRALKRSKLILDYVDDKELSALIRNEIHGYEVENTPEYRKIAGMLELEYVIPWNQQKFVKEFDINEIRGNAPNELQFPKDDLRIRTFVIPIVQIESFLDSGKEYIEWHCPNNQSRIFRKLLKLNTGTAIIEAEKAWWAFHRSAMYNIYSRTQNQLIEILQRLRKENKTLNHQMKEHEMKVPKSGDTINNFGNVSGSTIAVGSNIEQRDIQINYNAKVDDLVSKVLELGYKAEDADELRTILNDKKNNVIARSMQWLGKMGTKASELGVKDAYELLKNKITEFWITLPSIPS